MIMSKNKKNNFLELDQHIAVSSLESPIHATRKNPNIITTTWFIGKRCNYDCSYCPSYVHDNYSAHINKDHAFHFLNELEKYALEKKKKLKLSITGGEPFVHPNFLEILKYAKERNNLIQLSVVTNGSLPLKVYQQSADYLTNITVSLHLEQEESIIKKTIDKIISLNEIKKWFLNVNLMCSPGKFELIKKIIYEFNKNKIKFILRKINPPFEDSSTIKSKKDFNSTSDYNFVNKNFIEKKITKKTISNKDIIKRYNNYYSKKELAFLNKYINNNQWNNIKLHYPNKQLEFNTDELQSRNLNTWQGWRCYIGIDSIYVQHDGTIFRGNCMQGEMIGKIGSQLNWPVDPLICPIKWCTCNTDMCVRKVKNKKFDGLIND